ncbi:MAG: pyridoxamine 5'-phosphate oxidase family protein [Halomonas sp.]|nr:pyridoxamine 5'-phosphate oxidase family protein [Halomonas sp.]
MSNPHPWAADLGLLHDHIWSRLIRGVHDRHAPTRHPTLATVSANGMPQARTVVLRDADKQAATLTLYTDLHSAKVTELRANLLAELHVWDPSAHLQIRLAAEVTILEGAEVAERWQRLPEHSRSAYSSGLAPGKPIADSLAYAKTPDQTAFGVLRLDIQTIDALHLGPDHRRAGFSRADHWEGQWRVP